MSLRTELDELLRLAGPLILMFVGFSVLGFVDTAMVGRLGAASIGGAGIGGGLFMSLTFVGAGCVMGMDPLVAQAVGAGEHAHARRLLWQGVRVAVVAALVLLVVQLTLLPLVLKPMRIEPDVARETRRYLLGRSWGVIPMIISSAQRSYLQALGRTRPLVVNVILMNAVNVVGNIVLVFGIKSIGFHGLGVVGTGLSSTIAGTAGVISLGYAISAIEAPPDPRRRAYSPEDTKKIVEVGLPIGLQMLAEISAFTIASMLSGRIGKLAAAGNQIALQLASMSFMAPLGISSATSVLVGKAIGRGDTAAARRAGALALGTSAAIMSLWAISFVAVPRLLSGVLTNKADVIAAAAPLVRVAAIFQLSDGTQVTAAGALRGAGHTTITFVANVIGHFAVGLPLAVGLAFGMHLGARGLWFGMSAGLTTVAAILAVRFFQVTRKAIARL
jgi:MATE family multidrug resistance protein